MTNLLHWLKHLANQVFFYSQQMSYVGNGLLKVFSDSVANNKNLVNVKWISDKPSLYEIVHRLYQLPGRSAITLTLEKHGA